MTVKKEICSAFCDGLSIREIPLGYAITTPFSWLHGEPLVIFGEKAGGLVRMRDGGDTLTILEDFAGDLTTETKMDAMRQLAIEHGVLFDEDKSLFVSDWTEELNLGGSAIRFMSFLNRIQDLALLSRERVTNAFREELFNAIKERFGARFFVREREALSRDHREFTADIVIRDARIQAAVYAATSEVNVLEALLTEQVFKEGREVKTVPVVVFEDFMQSKVKTKTRRRVMNSSGIEIADWEGGAEEVLAKIEQLLTA